MIYVYVGELYMVGIEKRKIQKTGSSSFIITLPKEWIETTKLKSGDYVLVEKVDDKLVITPPTIEPSQLKMSIRIYPGVDVFQVFRIILASYITGYTLINIVFDENIPDLAKFISDVKNTVRVKLPGIEVIEETYNSVTLKVLLNIHELPLISAIRRLHLIVNSMLQDSITLTESGDLSRAHVIIQRDDEADRFHHMIVRELSIALLDISARHELGIMNIAEVLSYRIIARNLERIADHVTNIAKRYLSFEIKKSSNLIRHLLIKDMELLEKAMDALYTSARRKAEEAISESKKIIGEIEDIYDKVLNEPIDGREKAAVTLILDSIKRIARYSNGIAEAVLNIKVARTPEIDVK